MSNLFAYEKGRKLSLEEVDNLSEVNDKPNKIWQTERFWFAALFALLMLISALTLSDLIEDHLDGAPFTHLLVEALVIGVCITVAIFFLVFLFLVFLLVFLVFLEGSYFGENSSSKSALVNNL